MNLREKLLVLYLISISIFRVDLGANKFSFSLTPAIVASLVLFLYLIVYLFLAKWKNANILQATFLILITTIGTWFLARTIFFDDILQVKRFILFATIIVGTGSFFLLLSFSDDITKLIQKFISWSLFIYVAYSALDCYLFFVLKIDYSESLTQKYPFLDFNVSTISYYFPRLKGAFLDSNIAGYFLISVYLLIKYFKIHQNKIWIITLLILATMSRSAIGVFLFVVVASGVWKNITRIIQNRNFLISIKKIVSFSLLIITFFCASYYIANNTDLISRAKKSVAARLNDQGGSAEIHYALIERGKKLILTDPFKFLFGYGFGSSFLYTQDFFPGNKYANFHSESITLIFETGIVGYLIYIQLFLLPFIFCAFYRVKWNDFYAFLILAAMLLQNVFYQQYLFHYYWLFIGLAWFLLSQNLKNETSNKIDTAEAK